MSEGLRTGLYEQVMNIALRRLVDRHPDRCRLESLDSAEAASRLARYFTPVLEKVLEALRGEDNSVAAQIGLLNKIAALIAEEASACSFEELAVDEKAEELLAVLGSKAGEYGFENSQPARTAAPASRGTLFTGAASEPQLFSELAREIASCDEIELLVSFIKWSGLRLIIDELRRFTEAGGRLRVITTSYMGATDLKAVRELSLLPNTEISVSYDTERTRLHAKAYIFHRETGFGTAYIGSSNISNAALSNGLEWNIKIAQAEDKETFDKISATFESYRNSPDFEIYTEAEEARLAHALKAEKSSGTNDSEYHFDIRPFYYQQEILDSLEAERKLRGHYKNLIVAATGTGKTLISAFDFRNFCQKRKRPARLLFVAHREEILRQSLYAFRGVMRDTNFGECFFGSERPASFDRLFISIQTFNSRELTKKTARDYYDFIIIDEFHHAAAASYQKLLRYYTPEILLGLTATPERMDGKNVLEYFDNRLAAELRLPEAIDRGLLCPFQYFGVTDETDLSSVRWTNGHYDRQELSNIFTLDEVAAKRRAGMTVKSLERYVTSMEKVKAIGFCASVRHANFMASFFSAHGLPSLAVTGETSNDERAGAKRKLENGELNYIFTVDLYNEGVDIPSVNTILLLRPTESLTVFLQQLGRGLRLSRDKECLTVLDFIGQANSSYNFESRFAALLAVSGTSVITEIKHGFVSLPKGCYIRLERYAQKYILDNIRGMTGLRSAIIAHLASFEADSGLPLSLANFLDYYRMSPFEIYKKKASFSRLCAEAKVSPDFNEAAEEAITASLAKIAAIDSFSWIKYILGWLKEGCPTALPADPAEAAMLRMLCATLWRTVPEELEDGTVPEAVLQLRESPVMREELRCLLEYNLSRINLAEEPETEFAPLELHCSYSRDQLLLALGYKNPQNIREGVKWLPERRTDVLMVTLNKADKDYSPTTMYRDYSINDRLFHWQSQSTTSESSETGRRYRNHAKLGTKILLFVREAKKDSFGNVPPYTFLGEADYVKHDGSRPVNVTWRLKAPIPARFLKKTNRLAI